MAHLLEDFQSFLGSSPTSWHAVQEMGNRLASLDFIPLDPKEKWHLELGKSYFVSHGGTLAAFSLPKQTPKRAAIVATHTDSPALKIKPLPEIQKDHMTLLGVEVYGAPILATWAGKELAIAGRVVVLNNEQQLEERTVFIDDAPLYIPYLAIHLDREVNEKGALFNKQEHLLAIATIEEDALKQNYLEMLLRRHFSFHTLLSFDLLLVPLEGARFIGNSGEMIASYRLDNLASTHAALVALAKANRSLKSTIQIGIFCDHEEIGSESEVGAESCFFPEILERIAHCLNINYEEQILLKKRSLCISADMAQGYNPIYPQKYDPNHKVFLGKGIAIKYNAGLRYVSSAPSSSKIIHLCQKHNLRYQLYVNRSDIVSGSTVGPIMAKKLGVDTVDMGCPQLSMHASRELMACQDYLDMCQLLTHFFEDEDL